MQELIKQIEDARKATWERIDQMDKLNQMRESKGDRRLYDNFDFGKQRGYLNGLSYTLEKIKQYIEQTKPTEPVTETGK